MKNKKVIFEKSIVYIFLIIAAIVAAFPLVYSLFGSFKSSVEFLNGGPNILPKEWDMTSYVKAWKVILHNIL